MCFELMYLKFWPEVVRSGVMFQFGVSEEDPRCREVADASARRSSHAHVQQGPYLQSHARQFASDCERRERRE